MVGWAGVAPWASLSSPEPAVPEPSGFDSSWSLLNSSSLAIEDDLGEWLESERALAGLVLTLRPVDLALESDHVSEEAADNCDRVEDSDPGEFNRHEESLSLSPGVLLGASASPEVAGP